MDPHTQKLCDALDELLVRYDQFERSFAQLDSSLKSDSDPLPELFDHLQQLCQTYLDCDSDTRTAIRAFVADRAGLGGWAWRYAIHLSSRILQLEDAPTLRLALAAIAIENCSYDYRDTLMILADLYVRAEEVGIDPKPHFQAASELSTDAPTPGGCDSLRHMMQRFESYAVVSERRSKKRPYLK